jgi:hypothetical protein
LRHRVEVIQALLQRGGIDRAARRVVADGVGDVLVEKYAPLLMFEPWQWMKSGSFVSSSMKVPRCGGEQRVERRDVGGAGSRQT